MDPTDFIHEFIENTYGDAPYGLEDLSLIRTFSCVIGLPPGSPVRLKRYLLAAVQTYHLGNRSIDHVLKKYGDQWKLSDDQSADQVLLSQVFSAVKSETRQAYKRLHLFHKPAHCGTTSAWAALLRLQATIRSCVFTIRHGFHFETACLLRLFHEQLAWVSAVHHLGDLDVIFATEPSRCVATLKDIFPAAGFVYGYLSERAHLTPEQTTRYIISENGQLSASMDVREYAQLDAYVLLTLADWYIVLCDLTLAQHTTPTGTSLEKEGEAWKPSANRPFLRTLADFKSLLEVEGVSAKAV